MGNERKFYLAYGSNCNIDQMMYRCKGAVMVGKATLENHRLIYRRGYLSLLEDESKSTVCAVWIINQQHEKELDYYEGYPDFYDKKVVTATLKGGMQIGALVYVMQPRFNLDYALPSSTYINTCTQGYSSCDIDIQQLNDAFEEICEKSNVAYDKKKDSKGNI